jgi:hypothetical protein
MGQVAAVDASGLVLLHFEGQKLLLPQSEIYALKSVVDIDHSDKPPGGVGRIGFADGRWPVYALTRDFTLMADIPASRRLCILLGQTEGYLGLVFDNLTTLQINLLKHYPLPPCMKNPNSPLQALAILGDEEVGLVSFSCYLEAFLRSQIPCQRESKVGIGERIK